MKTIVLSVALATAIFLSPQTNACAGFFEQVRDAVTAPVRAPLQAAQDIASGRPPNEVVQNQLNIQVGAPAVAAGSTLQLIQRGNDFIQSIPRDAIRNNLGDDWLRGYDTLTASQRVQQEIAFTSGRFLGQCVQTRQCNINQIGAVPVAAAMRDAYKVYIGYSAPLGPDLVQILSRVVPLPVLNAARWTVGDTPDFTAPGFLNAGYTAFGMGHAVTLGNVMIFSAMPDLSTENGVIWLLHELFHIEQYMRYSYDVLESIDGFAVDYVGNYNAMENEAQSNAVARYNLLQGMVWQ
jgi:hypothetical protein